MEELWKSDKFLVNNFSEFPDLIYKIGWRSEFHANMLVGI